MKAFFNFFLIFFIVAAIKSAAAAPLCPPELAKLPILAGGRVKPLGTHAKEVIKFLTGKTRAKGKDALTVYCEVSLGVETIQLEKSHDRTASTQNGKNFAQRVQLYQNMVELHDWNVPVLMPPQHAGDTAGQNHPQTNVSWLSFNELRLVFPDDLKTPQDIVHAALVAGTKYTQQIDDAHLLEWRYEKARLFHWAIVASLLTLLSVFIFKKPFEPLTAVFLFLIYSLEITAIVWRALISGRAPVTNMYETVMWVGLGALTFATLLTLLRREKIFLGSGLILNISCLFMMSFAGNMLSPSIQPLVPVLRDNFWLSTHVTMVTVSYAAFALSWLIANYYMIKSSLTGMTGEKRNRLNLLAYDCLKIGVVLLSLGVILGGVWADYSWGRFWGWDPKETWALIALLTYIAILHGRYAGWITPGKFLPAVGLAFLTILMAWFGVNFILATGLHSYGFSNGGAVFIASLVTAQTVILTSHLWRRR